jgi:hypothetical protein
MELLVSRTICFLAGLASLSAFEEHGTGKYIRHAHDLTLR